MPAEITPEMSAQVVCCIYLLTLLNNVSIDANSVDPYQTAPVGSTLCVEVALK